MNKESIKQFIKFGLVGVSNTLISEIVYSVSTLWVHYIFANVLAFIISVLNAYILQNIFVFKQEEGFEKRVWWQVLLKTYTAYAFTGLLLSSLLLFLWIDIIKIERFTVFITDFVNRIGIPAENRYIAEILAPILNIVVNVPINFVINKFWAYRQKKGDDVEGAEPEEENQ